MRIAKQRWIIEHDYQELKQELGLAHYEGRGWRGFHHHSTLCIAAYGFLLYRGLWVPGGRTEPFFPLARAGQVDFPEIAPQFHPRGSPRALGAA